MLLFATKDTDAPGALRAPGSAWVRRHQFRPEPAKNVLLGARLGLFFGAGAAKTHEESPLGVRLEMLLDIIIYGYSRVYQKYILTKY